MFGVCLKYMSLTVLLSATNHRHFVHFLQLLHTNICQVLLISLTVLLYFVLYIYIIHFETHWYEVYFLFYCYALQFAITILFSFLTASLGQENF